MFLVYTCLYWLKFISFEIVMKPSVLFKKYSVTNYECEVVNSANKGFNRLGLQVLNCEKGNLNEWLVGK